MQLQLGSGYLTEATQDAPISSRLILFAEQRPWIERTGWGKIYRGRDRELLSALIEMTFHLPEWRLFILAQGSTVGIYCNIITPASNEKEIIAFLTLVHVIMD